MNLFNTRHFEMGISEIAREIGLPKSTVAGLVHTLEVNHLLEQNPDNRKYTLGIKLVEYGSIRLNQIDLRALATPFLHNLLTWCNESVNLAIWDETWVVYIERMAGTNMLGMRSEIGKREPIYSTALGKSILSCLSEREVRNILSEVKLSPKTPYTLIDTNNLVANIHLCHQRGYAIDDQENELGGRCVAAPILDFRGKPIAAISVSAPIQRLPAENIPMMGEKVREVALDISKHLGYLPETL